MSRSELRWRIASGRWQRPCRGIIVAHSGPVTESQRVWAALLWAGSGAVLAGLTAARLEQLQGFSDRDTAAGRPVHVLLPSQRSVRRRPSGLSVVVHYSFALGPGDIHPLRQPPRTRISRSLVDAAAWMATDRGAQAVLAAGVQQRLVRVEDLMAVVSSNQRLPRRGLIKNTLHDIAGGARHFPSLTSPACSAGTGCPSLTGRRSGSIRPGAAAGSTRCGKRPGSSSRWTASTIWTRPSTGRTWTGAMTSR